ncbi:MAG: hypothetical protein C4523_15435 [Myxococcales bacterium]|nr:MAG: hypothetical protein C4523_15435 [Myxococcales bacterium]
MRQMFLTFGSILLALLALASWGCESNAERTEIRKWMTDRTEQFVNVYKVAYERVSPLQGGDHPCTSGHKAEPAALFHAVLANLHSSYVAYKNDVQTHLGAALKADPACKNLLTVVEQLVSPFADEAALNQCGKVDGAQAKSKFFLQHPAAVTAAVESLRVQLAD